jgi:hypothetical protein
LKFNSPVPLTVPFLVTDPLRFVESGEILQRHPAAKGRRIAICVVFRFQPDQEALHFLARVRRVVESAGMAFRYELFAVSYEN